MPWHDAIFGAMATLVYRAPQRPPAARRQAMEAACVAQPRCWAEPLADWEAWSARTRRRHGSETGGSCHDEPGDTTAGVSGHEAGVSPSTTANGAMPS